MSTRIYKCCKHCGSREVVKDAWASWDDSTNQWVLEEVFDDQFCRACEEGGDIIKDVTINPELKSDDQIEAEVQNVIHGARL